MKWIFLSHLCSAVSATAAVMGIDLGTDFVKASLVAPNAPFEIVSTPDSQRKDASGLVIKPEDSERIYGSAGVSSSSRFPGQSLYATKQSSGLAFDDLRVGSFSEVNPGLELVPTKRNTVAVNVSGQAIPVEEIAAMQIAEVVKRGANMVKERLHTKDAGLKQIASSVPGHFGSAQRQALVDAVSLANLESSTLISDGAAVAINYANSPSVSSKLSTDEVHNVVVYDVGASGASATLVGLSLANDTANTVNVDVKGYGYALESSGRASTTSMRELILQRFVDKHGAESSQRTPRLMNRLWREAERAKQVSSANTEVHVYIESLANDKDSSTKITRADFEAAAEFQTGLVTKPLDEALKGHEGEEIDSVSLVGGATRTPFILEKLAAAVGEAKSSKNVNADEANVQGTATRAINISGIFRSKRKFNVTEGTAKTYTLEVHSPTINDRQVETAQVFAKGNPFKEMSSLVSPKDVTKLVSFEDTKKMTSWEFPHLTKNINSSYEAGASYTCTKPAESQAKFLLNANGIVTSRNVEAVCDAVKAEKSSTTDSVTDSTVSESEKDRPSNVPPNAPIFNIPSNGGEFVLTLPGQDNQQTSKIVNPPPNPTGTAATPTGSVFPKTRRVSVQADWEQAPSGTREQSDIRVHSRSMDKLDKTRQEHIGLSHELETLAYKIRGLVSEGEVELKATADKMLDYVESGLSDIAEVKKYLAEAEQAVAGYFKKAEADPEAETKEKRDVDSEGAEDASEDASEDAEAATEAATEAEEPKHEEL